jgi:hypothetical protein
MTTSQHYTARDIRALVASICEALATEYIGAKSFAELSAPEQRAALEAIEREAGRRARALDRDKRAERRETARRSWREAALRRRAAK